MSVQVRSFRSLEVSGHLSWAAVTKRPWITAF